MTQFAVSSAYRSSHRRPSSRVAGVAEAVGVRIEAVVGDIRQLDHGAVVTGVAGPDLTTARVQRVDVDTVQDGVVIVVRIQRVAAQVSVYGAVIAGAVSSASE